MEKWKLVATVVLGLATLLFGIYEFSQDSARRAASADFEAKKPFLSKQMDLCIEASDIAAKLATSRDSNTWNNAQTRFWELYWGPLSIVETPFEGGENVVKTANGRLVGPVENQMVTIGDKLRKLPATVKLPISELEDPSLELAHRCRDLILTSWKIK